LWFGKIPYPTVSNFVEVQIEFEKEIEKIRKRENKRRKKEEEDKSIFFFKVLVMLDHKARLNLGSLNSNTFQNFLIVNINSNVSFLFFKPKMKLN